MKSLLLLSSFLLSFTVHANDGGIALINVKGIEPVETSGDPTRVIVTGQDTNKLREVLPSTDVDKGNSLAFLSRSYAIVIACQPKHEGNKEASCMFDFSTRRFFDKNGIDSDIIPVVADDFKPYTSVETLRADKIEGPAAQFSFYGEQTKWLADKTSEGVFQFKAEDGPFVTFGCMKEYIDPITFERRKDGICTVSLTRP